MAEAPTQSEPIKTTPNKPKRKAGPSNGAQRIEKLLKGMDILYSMEVSYAQCKDKKVLLFDFQIIVNGRVGMIEYDGKQHFEETPIFKIDAEKLARSKIRDIIKNRFSRDRSISMLRVAYTEDVHLEKWVNNYIDQMKAASKPVFVFQPPLLYSNPFDDKDEWGCVVM